MASHGIRAASGGLCRSATVRTAASGDASVALYRASVAVSSSTCSIRLIAAASHHAADGKRIHVGYYTTEEEAAKAYDQVRGHRSVFCLMCKLAIIASMFIFIADTIASCALCMSAGGGQAARPAHAHQF